MNHSILIIDDDRTLAKLLRYALLDIAPNIVITSDYESIKPRINSHRFDLIVLDLFLPRSSGIEILKEMRRNGVKAPVIMVTGRTELKNEIEAYENGANLFHPKPIKISLLKTQVRSLLKIESKIYLDRERSIQIDNGQRVIRLYSNTRIDELQLTKKEFNLIFALIKTPGNFLTREELVHISNTHNKDLGLNSIDTLVSRLRTKLRSGIGVNLIETVHGIGFRLSLSDFATLDKASVYAADRISV